ncbi:hypothetical protein QCA50_018900 [Cerrena zonata]|uniref:Uncharacterized protein n=1 Tax=Cerrena zonata TaxID=2478898 RepID=A0AAW0FFS8_9APHY
MPTNVQCSPEAHSMLDRYSFQNRNLHLYISCVLYRQRKKPAVKLTAAEKKARHDAFTEKQDQWKLLLEEAQGRVWQEAEGLATKLGHTPQYWYECLVHLDATPAAGRDINLHWIVAQILGFIKVR